MADVAPARGKRARSPSPGYVDTLASPLEVLLKRRRRSEWASASGIANGNSSGGNGHMTNHASANGSASTAGLSRMFAPPPPPIWQTDEGDMGHTNGHGDTHASYNEGDNSSQAAASSPLRYHTSTNYDIDDNGTYARRAVERRRTRQWERLQDPSAASTSAPNTAHPSASASMFAHHHHSYSQTHLPLHQHHDTSHIHSHSRSNMSMSSPADRRTQATPERPANNMSSSPVRHNPPSSTPFRADDEWTEDERMREWGDEYASQNSVLYSLHRARMETLSSNPPTPVDNPMLTPARERSASTRQDTPYGLPTPYRHHRTPLDTPGLISSEYAASSPFDGPYSPLNVPSGPAPSPAQNEMIQDAVTRYEETNRLLAALNVARLRRHESEPQTSPLGRRTERGAGAGSETGMMIDD